MEDFFDWYDARNDGLMFRVLEGDLSGVKRLIVRGESVNSQCFDGEGDTLLIAAINNDDVRMVKLLLENGAEVDAKNDRGMTALFTAVFEYRFEPMADLLELVKLLLDFGANCEIECGPDGESARSIAQSRNMDSVMELFDRPIGSTVKAASHK